MGNCVSPASAKLSVKVVLPDGKLEEYRRSVVVAELMMEHPNHFVCHSAALTSINRKSVLSTDMELEAGRLYYLLPYNKFQEIMAPETSDAPGNKAMRPVNPIQQLADAQHEMQSKQNLMVTSKGTLQGDDMRYLVADLPTRRRKSASQVSPDLQEVYTTNQLITRSNFWKPDLETIQEVSCVPRSKKQRVHNWEESSGENSRSESAVASAMASPKASIKEAAVLPVLYSTLQTSFEGTSLDSGNLYGTNIHGMESKAQEPISMGLKPERGSRTAQLSARKLKLVG